MSTARAAARIGPVLLLALVLVGALATPASAHGIGGIQPSNYKTTLTGVEPTVRGVTVETLDLGTKLRLTNDTDHDVIVMGYADDEYLRVGPRGVFENRRSPATYANRSLVPTEAPPAFADADAPPQWRKISDGHVASWHDHRAHFMGNRAPPMVRADPDSRHLIERWTVPLRDGTRTLEVRGTLTYIPPPSPWPSVVVIAGATALVIGLSRTRHWRAVLVVALALLVACSVAHAIGIWGASAEGLGTKLAESLYSIAGVGLGLLALGWIWRRDVDAGVPFVLVASVFLLVAGGLADISTLGHSQVPSSFAPSVARLLVALTIGLGAGLAVAAGLRLRSIAPPPTGGRSATRAPLERSPITS